MKIKLSQIPSPIIFLIALLMHSEVSAEPIYYSMDQAVSMSELIVIANIKSSYVPYPEKGNDTISVKEVLLGDQSFNGKDIVIPAERRHSCGCNCAAVSESRGVAVLFYKDWQTETWFPISKIYEKPEELKTLRRLTSLLNITDERNRLIELAKVYSEGNPVMQGTFLEQMNIMEDRNNLDIIIDFYNKAESATQLRFMWTLASKNDFRVIPALTKTLSSDSRVVRVRAARLLNDFYNGSPELTAAFEKHLNTDGIEWITANYLAKRNKSKKYQRLVKRHETKANKILRLEKEGKPDEARKVEFEVIADKTQSAKDRKQVALKVIENVSHEEMKTIQKSLFPLLEESIEQKDLDALLDNVKLLRAFRQVECLPLLLKVLEIDTWQSQVRYNAIMAVRELGMEATRSANDKIIASLKSLPDIGVRSPTASLIELLWLGDEKTLQEGREVSLNKFGGADYFKDLEFLHGINTADNKLAFLLNSIENQKILSAQEINDWIVLSIGEFKDPAAVPVLINYLIRVNEPSPLANVANLALQEIGGEPVAQQMIKLLTHKNRAVRATSTEVLA